MSNGNGARLTLLQELKPILQATLVANEQQAPIFLGPVVGPFLGGDLGPVLDPSADHSVRIDPRGLRDVAAGVHLAHVRGKGAGLLRARVELELVSALWVRCQGGIVAEGRDSDRGPRLPAARESGAQKLGAVDGGVPHVEGVLG